MQPGPPPLRIHQAKAVNPLTWMQTSQAQTPQTQTPAAIHTPDTSVPMDIDQSQPRLEMCTCHNCGKPSHLSCTCMKPGKQRIWETIWPKWTSKSSWLR